MLKMVLKHHQLTLILGYCEHYRIVYAVEHGYSGVSGPEKNFRYIHVTAIGVQVVLRG